MTAPRLFREVLKWYVAMFTTWYCLAELIKLYHWWWKVPAVPYKNPNNYVKYSGRLAEALAQVSITILHKWPEYVDAQHFPKAPQNHLMLLMLENWADGTFCRHIQEVLYGETRYCPYWRGSTGLNYLSVVGSSLLVSGLGWHCVSWFSFWRSILLHCYTYCSLYMSYRSCV